MRFQLVSYQGGTSFTTENGLTLIVSLSGVRYVVGSKEKKIINVAYSNVNLTLLFNDEEVYDKAIQGLSKS